MPLRSPPWYQPLCVGSKPVTSREPAVRLRRPGEYELQAAVTALQIQAPDAESTDWPQIAELYGALARLKPSPVIDLNRAVAVGLADGPAAGLALLAPLLAERTL